MLLLAALLPTAVEPSSPRTYSAVAVHSARPDQPHRVDAQSTRLQASQAALSNCRAKNVHNDDGHCEIVALDQRAITPATQLAKPSASQPHPLFLWQYRSATSTVFLVGSVHILPASLYPLPEPMLAAFERSDHLVLEVDTAALETSTLQAKISQYALLDPEQQLIDILGESLHHSTDEALRPYGITAADMAQFKPALVSQQLVLLALMSIGYDTTMGLEHFFVNRGGSRSIEELESIDFQLDLLYNQPLPTQSILLAELIDQMEGFEDIVNALIGAWLQGDDDALEKAFVGQSGDSPEAQAFTRALIDERNVGMTAGIKALFNRSGTFFVLVGAGHFVGPNSIIALLDQDGIRGTRILSDHQFRKP